MDKPIGKVTHYFGKIGVAVVKANKPIKKGDTIKIKHGDKEFDQVVSSMQVEHEDVDKAKAGDEVGMKVDNPVKEGYKVFKS